MMKWNTGPNQPTKKWPLWIYAGLLVVYIISLAAILIPFCSSWDARVEQARRPESARYDARWE